MHSLHNNSSFTVKYIIFCNIFGLNYPQSKDLQQLKEEDKQTIFQLLEKMLTNKKFKDFFQKNAAAR